MTLRANLIRLAHENPSLRKEILPLLKEGAGPDYRDMLEAGRRLLKGLKPGKSRKETIKTFASLVTKDPVLMDWFYNRAHLHGGEPKLNYHSTRDSFGESLADWKDRWELSESADYEDMSSDSELLKIIQSAVDKHKPTGAEITGINWSKVQSLYSGIKVRLDFAKSESPEALAELRKMVADLQAALNP